MVLKKISLLEFENNSNIGLYMFVNDKFALLGQKINQDKKKEIEKILNVPVYDINILNTQLVGIFVSGNNNLIIIPEILDSERSKLEVISKKHKVKIVQIKDKINTFGNNICLGENEVLINDEFNLKTRKLIENKTNLKTYVIEDKQFKAIGGICRFIDGKYFISQELDEKNFSNILSKISGVGTVNSGSNFISSGIVGNKFGLLIGSNSSTIEIQSLVDAFN